jgi:hypothetical protein
LTAAVAAGAGFLLAVLWFDLMFDAQVRARRGAGALPDDVLASIAAYYGRVTTTARPMNRLVAAVMVATLAANVVQITATDAPRWAAWPSLGLLAAAVGLAGARTVRNAVRLGMRGDDVEMQSALARSIARDHVFCLAAVGTALALQLLAQV